jgi:DNA-directed RNA polymerase subunit RPC12/RpoP
METVSVRCNHCGASLKAGEQTRFITCQFCNSQLEIKRTDTSIFTEEIQQIAQTTRQMAGSLDVIELQNEIERLDREWTASNPVSYNKDGQPIRTTSSGGAAFGLVFAIIFAIVCFSMAGFTSSIGAPGIFPLIPVGMGIFAIVAGIMGIAKANDYQSRNADYQGRRAAMLARLETMRRK